MHYDGYMPKPWYYDALVSDPSYSFADWDSVKQAIPEATAGVYTIWIEEDLIYVGMSGRDDKKMLEAQKQGMPYGLIQRLKAHQSGRRSGDQFCVYVSDRLVLKTLSEGQIQEITDGKISMDQLTKDFIHTNCNFRFIATQSAQESFSVEDEIKQGSLGQTPLLN